jgi:hypothetical protein
MAGATGQAHKDCGLRLAVGSGARFLGHGEVARQAHAHSSQSADFQKVAPLDSITKRMSSHNFFLKFSFI